jgi:hypothetical protein
MREGDKGMEGTKEKKKGDKDEDMKEIIIH